MWQKANLRTRIYLLLAALILVALLGGMAMISYTYRMQELFTTIITRNMAAFESATSLETALVNQKGFVTYYFLDGNSQWLRQLSHYRKVFRKKLAKSQKLAQDDAQRKAIKQIMIDYEEYIKLKDRVIEYYKKGEREKGLQLHQSVRQIFFNIIDLCEDYKLRHLEKIQQARMDGERVAKLLRSATIVTVVIQMILVIGLGLFLIHQILVPVYQMLKNTTKSPQPGPFANVVTALSRNVSDLLENVDQAQQELEKSRENLLQAEKMALVGRLAAGMAHSIRNPFTSVKMRLFSLGRSLKLDATQQEDFEVISQEIRHIDTIVQNFLEFSRPPKLTMQSISPSIIVDNVLQLLSHRLDSYAVKVELIRQKALPAVMADPEQLKEVLVNLIINACEEMKAGGAIVIDEQVKYEAQEKQAVIYVSDNGPGVSPDHAEKIFQPFFTTKDEGTGLGLSIASRIVSEHGGSLTLSNEAAPGTTFIIQLPVIENTLFDA
ncbi:MAG: ATP-binding protein [Desulfobacteraceae bacterium]|jgi:signal transduction histidine kinase